MRLPRPPHLDVPHLVRTLQQHGVHSSAIVRELHVSPSAVGRWLAGDTRPGFRNGVELLTLLHRTAPDAVPPEHAELLRLLGPPPAPPAAAVSRDAASVSDAESRRYALLRAGGTKFGSS